MRRLWGIDWSMPATPAVGYHASMFNREPALVIGLIQTVLALVIAFGLSLSPEQVGAILAASAAALSLVTRSKVTPNA